MPAFNTTHVNTTVSKLPIYPVGIIGEHKINKYKNLCYSCYDKLGLYKVYYSDFFGAWVAADGLEFSEAKALFEALSFLNMPSDNLKKLTPLIGQSRLKRNKDTISKKDGLFWFFVDGLK